MILIAEKASLETMSFKFHSPLIPVQEMGRRAPTHVLSKFEDEIVKLILKNQILNLKKKRTIDFSIETIVITAQKTAQ